MNSQQKQQPLKLPPRAESLARLRALHDKSATAPTATAATQELTAPADDAAIKAATDALEAGDRMQDGSIFAGISPYTGKPMFAMPADANLTMTFNEAAQYAKDLNGAKTLGHDDWRVPTRAELNVLFLNREKGALKGTFNLTGSDPSGWYWSGTPFSDVYAFGQRFSDGLQGNYGRNFDSSVRCVR